MGALTEPTTKGPTEAPTEGRTETPMGAPTRTRTDAAGEQLDSGGNHANPARAVVQIRC